MNVYQFTTIGQFHTNHCEDFNLVTAINDNQSLLAVMDGCSAGTESHFAAHLLGKILKKTAKELGYKMFAERKLPALEIQLKTIVKSLFQTLQATKNQLDLSTIELLSTLILSVIDTQHQKAAIIVVGDGLVVCNAQIYEFEQENKPDYLAYHLNEDFESWYLHQQFLTITKIKDLSICTDGIFTFHPFNTKIYPSVHNQQILDYLLINSEDAQHPTMLRKKMRFIEHEWGLKPNDDLAVVRIRLK